MVLVQDLPEKGLKRVYLDRAQPRIGACPALPAVTPVGAGGTVSVSCGPCTTMPKLWQVTVQGISDGLACYDCSLLNGTWTLTYQSGCLWQGPNTGHQCATTGVSYWFLQYDPSLGTWELRCHSPTGSGGDEAQYRSAAGQFACQAQNTLALYTHTTANCANWPPNLTVVPG